MTNHKGLSVQADENMQAPFLADDAYGTSDYDSNGRKASHNDGNMGSCRMPSSYKCTST